MKTVSLKLLLLVSLLVAVVENGVSIQSNGSSLNKNSCISTCSGCQGARGGRGDPGPPPTCCKKDSDCDKYCPEGGVCSNQCNCVCKMVKVMNYNNVQCQTDNDCNMKCSKQGYCKLAF
ncbi:PREDICTED: defensin-like protein 260 [Camelina sativa]|uniref:Defensin-like protein 260 n=1 Tax=Camelina sativa TaxID=90675 RepID=A0ABM0X4E5_CAMSA|nr:PREDICTED: defensin-like protein 260 [Camelina sativa]